MSSFLESVIAKHCHAIIGVLHIGAHLGEEEPLFTRLGVNHQAFFEPVAHSFERLQCIIGSTYPVFQIALGNVNGTELMYVDTTCGMSSSLLKPTLVRKYYSEVEFGKMETVSVRRLDDIIDEGWIQSELFDFMMIDVQGYELEVLKGAEKFTSKFCKYIFCEVNNAQLYENGCLYTDIDKFLATCGFIRVEITPWNAQAWGDALYMKVGK